MMKRLFFLLLCLATFMPTRAQLANRATSVPPFKILLTNGSYFGYKNLQINKPLMLIYFSPDCDHCKDFTQTLRGKMGELRGVQIIMVSYFPLKSLQKFNTDFKLSEFSNIKIGTEGNSFLIPGYFKIGKFPFTVLYNKVGKLAATFREVPSWEVLSDFIKKL